MENNFVICPTTGKKLDPHTLIPISEVADFRGVDVLGSPKAKASRTYYTMQGRRHSNCGGKISFNYETGIYTCQSCLEEIPSREILEC